jgi:hypothetical protein
MVLDEVYIISAMGKHLVLLRMSLNYEVPRKTPWKIATIASCVRKYIPFLIPMLSKGLLEIAIAAQESALWPENDIRMRSFFSFAPEFINFESLQLSVSICSIWFVWRWHGGTSNKPSPLSPDSPLSPSLYSPPFSLFFPFSHVLTCPSPSLAFFGYDFRTRGVVRARFGRSTAAMIEGSYSRCFFYAHHFDCCSSSGRIDVLAVRAAISQLFPQNIHPKIPPTWGLDRSSRHR